MNEIKICGVQLESIEDYVDRQREIQALLYYCEESASRARGRFAVEIDGRDLPISDDTRPILLEFLTLTKLELQRQAREMMLVVRIGSEEPEEEDKGDEEDEIPVL